MQTLPTKIRYFFFKICFLLLIISIEARPNITITVSKDGWGEGRPVDIQKVLESAAQEVSANITSLNHLSILVQPSKDGVPRTLYRRGTNGEFIVLLSAKDRYWSQYSYQFGHELAHVLSINKATFQTQNQWFEESIGETCSRFALRAMSKTWQVSPPYPNWKSYSASLNNYVEELINDHNKQLPKNTTFVQWFKIHHESLRQDPYLRDKNAVIAQRLLPLFENYPESWDAIIYLNQTKPAIDQNFHEYLTAWYKAAPRKHRQFISEIGNLFGYLIG